MLQKFHQQICQQALEPYFSSRALDLIIKANLGQDQIRYQIGHPHFHFDSNSFDSAQRYIADQRWIVLETSQSRGEPSLAWQAFGRLTHAGQDFYAHSNYIRLWAATYSKRELPEPNQVAALNPDILQHPELHSGNIYIWDWLAFIPGFHSLAYRLTPGDSHTHMNLDSPKQGPLFPYAFDAALKRTIFEYEQIARELDGDSLAFFTDC